jgi:hypothetical protein
MHAPAAVELLWLPLGAGGWFVRRNGRIFEAVAARRGHRRPLALYHAALRIRLAGQVHVVEVAPVWNERTPDRGVAVEGPVGDRRLGRWRAFRYEIRCWRGGRVPDAAEAVDSPRVLTTDAELARRVLELVPHVPALTWGREERATGDMWNSNSVVAWLLVRAGLDAGAVRPPDGGRAPGWDAGLELARRDAQVSP